MVEGAAPGLIYRLDHTFRIPMINKDIRECWYDEIAAIAVFLLHLQQLPLLLKTGK
jgi:hypothetical protein